MLLTRPRRRPRLVVPLPPRPPGHDGGMYPVRYLGAGYRGAERSPAFDDDDPLSLPRALGRMHGQRFGGDPFAAARAEGVVIRLATPVAMARLRGLRLGIDRVAAFFVSTDWPERPTVYVDATLGEHQQRLSVAHELAHFGHGTWTEDMCEAFAAAFCAQR